MADSVELSLTVADPAEKNAAVEAAISSQLASRLLAQDATLWGPAAESEASIRLAWVTLAESSRPLIEPILALRDKFVAAGLDHIVLCGMGGSSLAPEVICHTAGVELTVLDSSQPDMVRDALSDRLDRSVVVVSSKSGSTVETDSQRRVYEQAFKDAGIDPTERIVVVTDPGSPLEAEATAAGYQVFSADPNVGGRYSALTAFGLVPSGLAGADIAGLLDDATAASSALFVDTEANPALQLGIAMGVAQKHQIDKLVVTDRTGHGLGDWIEQLVAESTGKQGLGILPVVVPTETSPNFSPAVPDGFLVSIGSDDPPSAPSGFAAAIDGPLAAQMLAWEIATAVASQVIGINPFDQPDVESAKAASRELLSGSAALPAPDSADGDIALFGSTTGALDQAVADLLDELDPDHGYVAVQAYLDRLDLASFAAVRESLATLTGRPVTFGWGPRFLHSTGQYHKGGTPNGVFIQITCEAQDDLPVPGRDFTLGQFCAAQAAGDAKVLRDNGRPVLGLQVSDLGALNRIKAVLSGQAAT